MLYRLLDESHGDYDCSSLERVIHGAAPIRSDRLEEAIEAFGPVFCQFYGQTEVPNLITVLGRHEHAMAVEGRSAERLESAGHPCLMSEVRIVDPDGVN
jgi:fatty-acyl-CoA synthase/long-chain acyl-CoA synthetase